MRVSLICCVEALLAADLTSSRRLGMDPPSLPISDDDDAVRIKVNGEPIGERVTCNGQNEHAGCLLLLLILMATMTVKSVLKPNFLQAILSNVSLVDFI